MATARGLGILSLLATAAALPAQWGFVTTAQPPGDRAGASMVFDVATNRMLLFGGNATSELWSFANGGWTQLTPSTTPSPRARCTLANDPIGGQVLLYGGLGGSQFALDDTWTWTGTDWQQVSAAATPGGLYRHAMAFDGARQVFVVYGGRYNSWMPGQALAGTYEFANGTWTTMLPVTSPPGLVDAAMAYLYTQGVMVLFGGEDPSSTAIGDTWLYDGTTWTQFVGSGPQPPARVAARMVPVLSRGVVMLSGGLDPVTMQIFNDTWEFDGTTWREVTGVYAGMYPPRHDFAMAHDIVRDRVVAFGGEIQNGGLRSDTWEYGAQFQPFGLSCLGSAGAPQLALGALPRIGTTCVVDLQNLVPTMPVAAMAVGLSRTQWPLGNLPALLTPLGMTGCRAYTSAELIVPLVASAGTASWSFTFPTSASLFGDTYHLQGLSLDPNWNPAWLVTSNAATLIVGH
ncbi:MAG: hypothetical protein JNL08_05360 [Planctomycetes bacterium]|nr:hypothetical protein [Planctomycetota bacterium]